MASDDEESRMCAGDVVAVEERQAATSSSRGIESIASMVARVASGERRVLATSCRSGPIHTLVAWLPTIITHHGRHREPAGCKLVCDSRQKTAA